MGVFGSLFGSSDKSRSPKKKVSAPVHEDYVEERGRRRADKHVAFTPQVMSFKPTGVRQTKQNTIELYTDEFEAMRLKHYEGMDCISGGEAMGISKSTFGRLYDGAVKKVTEALVDSYVIEIVER